MDTHAICPSGQSARRLERVNERLNLDDVVAGCHVVPVLQTAGGVWVKHKSKKLSEHSLGLIFEAAELLVVKGVEGTGSTSFNLDGIEVAEEEEPAAAGDEAESQIEA